MTKLTIRILLLDSPKKIMLMRTAAAVPIPIHTAYATLTCKERNDKYKKTNASPKPPKKRTACFNDFRWLNDFKPITPVISKHAAKKNEKPTHYDAASSCFAPSSDRFNKMTPKTSIPIKNPLAKLNEPSKI